MLSKKYRRKVLGIIELEGFEYAFNCYTDFKEDEFCIEDEEFHRLRDAYVKAQEELQDYIGLYEDDE